MCRTNVSAPGHPCRTHSPLMRQLNPSPRVSYPSLSFAPLRVAVNTGPPPSTTSATCPDATVTRIAARASRSRRCAVLPSRCCRLRCRLYRSHLVATTCVAAASVAAASVAAASASATASPPTSSCETEATGRGASYLIACVCSEHQLLSHPRWSAVGRRDGRAHRHRCCHLPTRPCLSHLLPPPVRCCCPRHRRRRPRSQPRARPRLRCRHGCRGCHGRLGRHDHLDHRDRPGRRTWPPSFCPWLWT